MDTKLNEKKYLKKLGPAGIAHALKKPFSDINCGGYLAEIGAIISLLPDTPSKILDIGCGTGWTSIFYARKGHEVTGIDISEDMIACAEMNKKDSGLSNLEFLVQDFEKTSYNECFDCVVSFDALHHATDERKVIEHIYAALKPGGICIISEPGMFHSKMAVAKKVMNEYGVLEKSIPPHLTMKYARKAGFKKFRVMPRAEYLNWALYTKASSLPDIFFFRKVFKLSFVRTLAGIFLIAFYKRLDGIVVMEK